MNHNMLTWVDDTGPITDSSQKPAEACCPVPYAPGIVKALTILQVCPYA